MDEDEDDEEDEEAEGMGYERYLYKGIEKIYLNVNFKLAT